MRCIKYMCQSGTQSFNMIVHSCVCVYVCVCVCVCVRIYVYIYIYTHTHTHTHTTQCLLVVSTVKSLIFFRVDNN